MDTFGMKSHITRKHEHSTGSILFDDKMPQNEGNPPPAALWPPGFPLPLPLPLGQGFPALPRPASNDSDSESTQENPPNQETWKM